MWADPWQDHDGHVKAPSLEDIRARVAENELVVRQLCHQKSVSLTQSVRPDGEVKWTCEQCVNDRTPLVSTDYACCLCLTEETLIDLVEPPRVSHRKKTDREREKERLEKELADGMRADYRAKQLENNRPPLPREPPPARCGRAAYAVR